MLTLVLFGFTVPAIYAKSESQRKATEYEIKAVYVYNYLLFTEWPPSDAVEQDKDSSDSNANDKTITIGILGEDPFGDSFSEVEDKVIKEINKKLVIKRLGDYSEEVDLKECDLLFICSTEKKNLKAILNRIKGEPILTVGDMKNFLETGGMINLLKVGSKVRWEINHTRVKESGLRLNSQLLRAAVRVIETSNKSESKTLQEADAYSFKPRRYGFSTTSSRMRELLVCLQILL